MARPIWTGSISFGLVNVPVKLFSATSSHNVSFHQLDAKSGSRIRYKRVAEETGEEVSWDDIVKGYEVSRGEYVTITGEELESVQPTRTRSIEIDEFVELDEIDPIVWNKTYYLAPQEDVNAERPYALLMRAMEETGKVAVGRFVMRSKEYLVTIRPMKSVLALETMYFADEVRSLSEVEGAPVKAEPNKKELEIAEQLIASLSGKWEHKKYRDTYTDEVMGLIERKAKGEKIKVSPRKEEPDRVVDLMQALKRSLEARKGSGAAGGNGANGAKGSNGKKRRSNGHAKDDLGALTKKDLLERAAKADIGGRTKMKKDELIAALQEVA